MLGKMKILFKKFFSFHERWEKENKNKKYLWDYLMLLRDTEHLEDVYTCPQATSYYSIFFTSEAVGK